MTISNVYSKYTEWVKVNCPHCHNSNRKARRGCKFCNKSGKVLKSVPIRQNNGAKRETKTR